MAQQNYEREPSNIHQELEELTKCEPLVKCRASRTDWLLDSTSHYNRSPGTTAASSVSEAVQPNSSFQGGKEDAISEKLPRVGSALTPHGTQQIASAVKCRNGSAGKSVTKNGAAIRADVTAPHYLSQDKDGVGAALITVEVSSSSVSPETTLSPSSLALPVCARSSHGTSRGPTGKRQLRRVAKRECKRRSSNSMSNPSSRSILHRNGVAAVSLTSKTDSRRSSAIALHSSAAVTAEAGRERVTIKKSCIPRLSSTSQVLTQRTPLHGKNQGARTTSPSPRIPSSETSVATVAAAKTKEGGRELTPSAQALSKTRMSSLDIVVSSESDTDAAPSASVLHYATKHCHSFPLNEQKRVQTVNMASTSASASTSAVAVLGVYEVCETGAAQPLADQNTKSSHVTLSRRVTTEGLASLVDKNAGLERMNAAAHGGEEVEARVPCEDLKHVAMEEEAKGGHEKCKELKNAAAEETVKREEAAEKCKAPEVKRRVPEENVQQQTVMKTEAKTASEQKGELTEPLSLVTLPTVREPSDAPPVAPKASNPTMPAMPRRVDEVVAACHEDVRECDKMVAPPLLRHPGPTSKANSKCCSVM
ncbi:hypothetical protein TraAM80_08043 [Trypanosoma rangeli]|uniref:Uncharacterized protein n=1 Tax=Trypanosoma rangeli TaxID=5698 RepID=A0A3R7NAV9_TRYRA|nr:uncharacterized protein TraAM80_08043 [Trypanosoma rangeli]RNE99713.1 hypothetical protein TraAM80_08043 [Trypanosoma rangeli]|eukprot:RNE99713.1 hypothetical protein TraAM80_08043 [Trypanosoma rangeli]